MDSGRIWPVFLIETRKKFKSNESFFDVEIIYFYFKNILSFKNILFSDELFAHIRHQDFWDFDRSVFLLIILYDRDKDPWRSDSGIVHRITVSDFSVSITITKVQSAWLEVEKWRHGMRFSIRFTWRHPAFQIMGIIFPYSHISAAKL